ncbi:MAG: hypothetical protein LUD46_09945 [Parabacteroides sp.]|nr:hypothetical protein [Parabacteroides sp.]
MPPIFYIIMGPNGAGKSTFGKLHTNGLPIYDPDKRRMEVITFLSSLNKKQRKEFYPAYTHDMFNEMFDELVNDYQKEEYEELRQHCVEQYADFALETPFADNFGLNEVLYFKSRQCIIHGIFFGLNTVEQSIANVSMRVKKKGHDLPIQSIEWNFNQCYLNLNQHFDLFDSILFMDAQNPLSDPILIAQYIQKRIIFIRSDKPAWLDRFILNGQ